MVARAFRSLAIASSIIVACSGSVLAAEWSVNIYNLDLTIDKENALVTEEVECQADGNYVVTSPEGDYWENIEGGLEDVKIAARYTWSWEGGQAREMGADNRQRANWVNPGAHQVEVRLDVEVRRNNDLVASGSTTQSVWVTIVEDYKPHARVAPDGADFVKINWNNEVGLGQQLTFGLADCHDEDLFDGVPVDDGIAEEKTHWTITGADAKQADGAKVQWTAKTEQKTTLAIRIDDVGMVDDDPVTDGTPLTLTVLKPAGEKTSWGGWLEEEPTVGQWDVTLLPESVYFTGIAVAEQDGGGGQDTAHFADSQYDPQDKVQVRGPWDIIEGNAFDEPDCVGWPSDYVTYYRHYSLPYVPVDPDLKERVCKFVLSQHMYVVIAGGDNVKYVENTLEAGFTETRVYSKRAGQPPQWRDWP